MHDSANRFRSVALAVTLSLVGARSAAAQPPEKTENLQARVDRYLAPLVESELFSGSVLLAKGGEILVERSYGKADIGRGVANTPQTQFKLMSVTKAFTGTAVLALVQAGKLTLDDPVVKHLPEWPAAWGEVTVGQLLHHTPGIPNVEGEWAARAHQGKARGLELWQKFAPQLAARPLEAEPDARYAYSNFNYVVLGLVIEAVTGRPSAQFVQTAILEPSRMKQTGFDDGRPRPGLALGYFRRGGRPDFGAQDMSVIQAAGDVYSTVGDLYRFDRALRGDTILRAETRDLMLTPTPVSYGYACGWQTTRVHDRPCVFHSGGANGYVADLLRFPEDDACVVVLSNFAFVPIQRISHDLAALLFDQDCQFPQKLEPAALDACAGVYRDAASPERALAVRRSGQALLAFDVTEGAERFGGELLLPLGEQLFRRTSSRGYLSFEAPVQGRCPGVSRGDTAVWKRDAAPDTAWRAAAGAYRTVPAPGLPLRINATPRRLALIGAATWDLELELVPVTESSAISLYSDDFGTLLRREDGQDGRTSRLVWKRNDGTTVEAAPHEKAKPAK